MSKIAKIPVIIKEGVTAVLEGNRITVTGPKGVLFFDIPQGIEVKIGTDEIMISKKDGDNAKMLSGLTRAIIANLVKGVTDGFEKKLELSGVGYRAQVSGNDLVLSLGFSHPVKVPAPEGIKFSVAENVIAVSGMDKALVGNVAATIRGIKPPEPYKGKGISYKGERIRRKVGKAAKAVGAK